jgi:hypothetical protein
MRCASSVVIAWPPDERVGLRVPPGLPDQAGAGTHAVPAAYVMVAQWCSHPKEL